MSCSRKSEYGRIVLPASAATPAGRASSRGRGRTWQELQPTALNDGRAAHARAGRLRRRPPRSAGSWSGGRSRAAPVASAWSSGSGTRVAHRASSAPVAVGRVLGRDEPVGEAHLVQRGVRREAQHASRAAPSSRSGRRELAAARFSKLRDHVRAAADARRRRELAGADVAAVDGLDQPGARGRRRHALDLRRPPAAGTVSTQVGSVALACSSEPPSARQRVERRRADGGAPEAGDALGARAAGARARVAGRAAAVVEDRPRGRRPRQDAGELDLAGVEEARSTAVRPGSGSPMRGCSSCADAAPAASRTAMPTAGTRGIIRRTSARRRWSS